MLRVGQLFRTIISFIENQFKSEQIYDNRYNRNMMMTTNIKVHPNNNFPYSSKCSVVRNSMPTS